MEQNDKDNTLGNTAEGKKKKCCKRKSIRKTIKILFALTILNTLAIAACLVFLCTYKPKVLLLNAEGKNTAKNTMDGNITHYTKDFYMQKTKARTVKTQIQMLEDALAAYKLDMGEYPSAEDGLGALRKAPEKEGKWNGPYLKSAVPKDPWGNDYIYTCPGERGDFELICYGADGRPGGFGADADISNFELD